MKNIVLSLLIISLLLPSLVITVSAQDYDELVLDGADVYSKGGEYFIDIPGSYQGSYINVFANSDSSQDSWYYFVFSYRGSSGEWIHSSDASCNTYHEIQVPVTPGQQVYVKVGICEKIGYSYANVRVRATSVSPTIADVYVTNGDDDDAWISLVIDSEFAAIKSVSPGSTDSYGSYDLSEGNHTFEISWLDPDTGEDLTHSQISDVYISDGQTETVYLATVEHLYSEPQPPASQPSSSSIEVSFIIDNAHSSPIEVEIYPDDGSSTKITVSSYSYSVYRMEYQEAGYHFVLFGWTNPVSGQAESHDWIRYNLTENEFVEVKIPEMIPISPKPSPSPPVYVPPSPTYEPTPLPSPTPTATSQPSSVVVADIGEITDGFAQVVGDFPLLFSDNDNSTYVRGGLLAGDYDAEFILPVEKTSPLRFIARVKCIDGGCGGGQQCGYRFYVKNQVSGEFDRIAGIPWPTPGIHEYEIVLDDADKYIRNSQAEFWFSFHCNMDGYVTEFYQIMDSVQISPPPTITDKPIPTPSPSETKNATISEESSLKEKIHILGLDLTSPDSLFGINLAGLPESNASDYRNEYLKSTFMGVGGYATIAENWEEVERFEFLAGKNSLNQAKNLGYIDIFDDILDTVYMFVSLKEACADAPGQLKTLWSIKSSAALSQNIGTLTEFTGNMAGIYDTVYKADQASSARVGIPEADTTVMMIIGAIATGGWSLLGDLSNAILDDNIVEQSINFKIQKGTLGYMLAYHAGEMQTLADNSDLNEDDIKEYFRHAERIITLKQLERLIDYREEVATWQENPDFTTRFCSFLGIIDTSAEIDRAREDLEEFMDTYEFGRENLESKAQYLEIELYE